MARQIKKKIEEPTAIKPSVKKAIEDILEFAKSHKAEFFFEMRINGKSLRCEIKDEPTARTID